MTVSERLEQINKSIRAAVARHADMTNFNLVICYLTFMFVMAMILFGGK